MDISFQASQWLSRLVQIPSVTPVQAGPKAGVPGEAAIAAAIGAWFAELGGEVIVDEVHPNRPNTYGIWRGQSDRWVALDVHVDTVGVEQMPGPPFSGAIQDGRVWGRGAVDTKASLGVALALLEVMQTRGLAPVPNLLIGATVDEEFGASGAPAFAAWLRRQDFKIDQMLVAEPTRCIPVYGHKGVARFVLTVRGESAHSSQPELGKNAVTAAAKIILAFAAEHERLQAESDSPVLGKPNLTVTIIQGGVGINVVPDLCHISVDRRVVDGENAADVIQQLYLLAQNSSPLPVDIQVLRDINAFLQPPDSPWVRELTEWSAVAPEVAPYGTNAWAYVGLPGECVVLGPGDIAQAHGPEEWVETSELGKLAQIYARWWGLEL
jgi:acetylornithine deacetylase/succinyl-diaminopimelate desuccinylase-like protein